MRLTQAQIARIKALENKAGQVTTRRVLSDARDKRSPLHALFDWDDTHAAEQWRKQQARVVIGSVYYSVTHHEQVIKSVSYVHDTSIKGGGYRSITAMKADPESARESLVYTLETAAGHLRRAYDLAAPLGLSREIDALLAQVAGVARLAQKKAA